jgi:hypothetical protein
LGFAPGLDLALFTYSRFNVCPWLANRSEFYLVEVNV